MAKREVRKIQRFSRDQWISAFDKEFEKRVGVKFKKLPKKLWNKLYRVFEDYILELEDYFKYEMLIYLGINLKNKHVKAIWIKKQLVGMDIPAVYADVSIPEEYQKEPEKYQARLENLACELKEYYNDEYSGRSKWTNHSVVEEDIIDLTFRTISCVSDKLTDEMLKDYLEPAGITREQYYIGYTHIGDFKQYMDMISVKIRQNNHITETPEEKEARKREEAQEKEKRRKKREQNRLEKEKQGLAKVNKSYFSVKEFDYVMYKPEVTRIDRATGNDNKKSFDFVEVSIPILSDVATKTLQDLVVKYKSDLLNDCLDYVSKNIKYKKFKVPTSNLKFSKWIITKSKQLVIIFEIKEECANFASSKLFS